MKFSLPECALVVVLLLCVVSVLDQIGRRQEKKLKLGPKPVQYTTGDMVFTNQAAFTNIYTENAEFNDIFYSTNDLSITVKNYQTQSLLVEISSGGTSIVAIDRSGKVTLGEGVSTNEAARAFWDAVARMAGHRCPGSNEVTWPEVER